MTKERNNAKNESYNMGTHEKSHEHSYNPGLKMQLINKVKNEILLLQCIPLLMGSNNTCLISRNMTS
ncbi:hypothetical protein POVCU2_0017050 [Plasmodium ovale curtisi]|uniref:Uncharacterized protein n=1 Tax=Plasmodium ovale curtisi TaxID=864141 RepID=A0A1A8VSX2_PLAOA|nr:hypothetical protein POVCU2_0017050 [Plasmodium ovale curtisi]